MFHQLSQEERYLIARGRAHHWSLRSIAMVLGRAPSTLSREVRRNAKDYDGVYRAKPAHSYAVARRRRCRRGSQFNEQQLLMVDQLIHDEWSPEQIAGRLHREAVLSISHETIYRRIRQDRKQGGTLWKHAITRPSAGAEPRAPRLSGRRRPAQHVQRDL